MIITRNEHHSLKLQAGEIVVAVNPVSKDSKFKSSKFGADIVLVTMNHEDFAGIDEVTFGDKTPVSIEGPGEYEIRGIFIRGFGEESHYGGASHINTTYYMQMDAMNVCYLGVLSGGKVSSEASEGIDEVDILFVPLSGDLPVKDAYKLAVTLEPKIIIPLGEEKEILQFAKEAGQDKIEKLDKLTLKKKDLDGKAGEVLVIM